MFNEQIYINQQLPQQLQQQLQKFQEQEFNQHENSNALPGTGAQRRTNEKLNAPDLIENETE